MEPTDDPAASSAADPLRDLMLAFQQGDNTAFDTLVSQAKRSVFAVAYRYGLDTTSADDLAQEVFLRVYRSRATYRPDARFQAWLLRIATNLIITEARKHKRRPVVPLSTLRTTEDNEVDLPDARAAAPWDRLDAEVRRQAIETALASLPERQRVALVLNRFHDQSYEDVGAALGMKVPAVKSLLFRARQSLKDALGPFMERQE